MAKTVCYHNALEILRGNMSAKTFMHNMVSVYTDVLMGQFALKTLLITRGKRSLVQQLEDAGIRNSSYCTALNEFTKQRNAGFDGRSISRTIPIHSTLSMDAINELNKYMSMAGMDLRLSSTYSRVLCDISNTLYVVFGGKRIFGNMVTDVDPELRVCYRQYSTYIAVCDIMQNFAAKLRSITNLGMRKLHEMDSTTDVSYAFNGMRDTLFSAIQDRVSSLTSDELLMSTIAFRENIVQKAVRAYESHINRNIRYMHRFLIPNEFNCTLSSLTKKLIQLNMLVPTQQVSEQLEFQFDQPDEPVQDVRKSNAESERNVQHDCVQIAEPDVEAESKDELTIHSPVFDPATWPKPEWLSESKPRISESAECESSHEVEDLELEEIQPKIAESTSASTKVTYFIYNKLLVGAIPTSGHTYRVMVTNFRRHNDIPIASLDVVDGKVSENMQFSLDDETLAWMVRNTDERAGKIAALTVK